MGILPDQRWAFQPSGQPWNVSYRCSSLCKRDMSHCCSNPWRYYRRCHMLRTLPRSIDGADQSRWRYFHRPGSIHRNVPHSRASLHHFHACCREAQRNIHCSRRHWSFPLHCRAHGRLLHRRLRQPSTLLWTFCREPRIPRVPLDLLGRSHSWLLIGIRLLQVHQDARIRNRQPEPR